MAKRKFQVGDEVELIGDHRYYGRVYHNEARTGDRMTVIKLTTELSTQGDRKAIPIYVCANPNRPAYDSLKVDEDCLQLYEEYSDEDVLQLFGVKPLAAEAHNILHKHHLKDGGLECAGCSWKASSRNGIRMKFADHLVEMLKKNDVLPTVRS